MRKDERLKTVYETIAPHITRTEGNWRDYLAFAARFHKHRFDNTLLVYAQNPNVTALATTGQWNKIGRYVNRGAVGIAVCEYENAKLTISHLFDISQTNGRAAAMTDWQLDGGMREELTKRLAYAHGLNTDAFSETLYSISAEAVSEHYGEYLQTLKAAARDHIFEELPEGGLEAQFISLLTDSVSYLTGKRCGLSDEEIISDNGISTIGHFNTIPLIATLGNAVTAISKGVLLEAERTIKIINKERTEQNERTDDTPYLHREGRTSVPESASLQQRGSGSAARPVRENGAGISAGQSPRPIYSFENGWQSDGDNAQGAERSGGENRSDDAGNAQNRPAAGNRGYAGENPPLQQPEAVGGGDRDTGDRPDREVTPEAEEVNTVEEEPSSDGSFPLPINEYLERMMLTTLFYPPNFFNRLRYIDAAADGEERKAERIKAAYLSEGNKSGEIEGTPVSVTAADEGLTFHVGSGGVYDYAFEWNSVQELVRGFIENGSFPPQPEVMSDGEVRRHYEYILTSENLYPKELHTALRSFLTDEPENADWSEKAEQTKAAFTQYGEREFQGEVKYRAVLRDEGLLMYFGNGGTFLPWNTLANIINAMIEDGNYPGEPEQAEETAEPPFPDRTTEYGYRFEYQLLSRLRTDCEYFLGNGNRAERHLWAGNVDGQIAKMRELYDLLPEKPEWLTEQEIDSYERRMKEAPVIISAETPEEARQLLTKAEYVVSDEMLENAVADLNSSGSNAPTVQQIAEQAERTLIDEAAELDAQDIETVLSVVEEYAQPPEEISPQEANELFREFSPLFISKALHDEKYMAAREGFTDETKAKIECGFAAERIMQSLREDNPKLYAAYAGHEGFRDRMAEYVFDRTYTQFVKELAKLERNGLPKKRATVPERNFRAFEKLFPKIVSGEYASLKLEAGDGYDPLIVSHKYDNRYAMEHYHLQNGDAMYDPYMEFLLDTEAETMQAASFENSGMDVNQQVYAGDGYYPKLQKDLNNFLTTWMKNISQQGYVPVRAIALVNGEDKEILFNKNGNPIPETAEKAIPADESAPIVTPPSAFAPPSQSVSQLTLFDFSPAADPVREREEWLLSLGSGVENGKQRIYDFALTQPAGSAFASFLRGEYGTGGGTVRGHGIAFQNHDGGGIRYRLEDSGEEIKMSWAKAAGIIQRLVNENRYLDAPAEAEEAQYSIKESAQETGEEIRLLDEVTDSHHGQLDMVMTAYMGETPVGSMQYSLYENEPHISMIEVLPEYRRRGIATRMLRNLQAQYPETEIAWGMLTGDGKALYDALTYSVENEEYTRRKNDLDEITAKYNQYEKRLDNGGILSPMEGDDMNDLSDIQYRLEQELAELSPAKTFVRLSDEEETAERPLPEPAPASEPKPAAHNFRYSEDMDLYPSGAKSKYKANVEAIKLLKAIEGERRQATPKEQLVLARYVGWGGLANAFSAKSDEWAKEYQELKTLLSGEEYKAAMESTLTAYYTEPELIRHIYDALDRFGFKGGAGRKLLDPAMGTGNFYAVLPESLAGTKLYGVELDSITGRIARQLYPEADIQVRGYETTKFEDNSFDAAIGNIPFNSVKVYDPRYNSENFLIHDYFIAKTLDLVKPGGIIAFITSKGTLDKNDESTREYIAERAELIGAVRLPNTAFKALAGTEVTADIIFLKKREKQIELSRNDLPEWITTETERGKWIRYNSYFHNHPEMVLGEMVSSRNMYGREDGTACVAPDDYDLYAELDRAAGSLQAEFSAEPDRAPAVSEEEAEDEETEYADAPEGTKNFTFVVQGDDIFFCEKNKLIPQSFTGMKAVRVKGLCEIRTALLDVIAVQSRASYEESELKEKQAVLNEVYDRFVKKCGAVGSKGNILVFSDDDQFPLLRSIENEVKDKDGNITFEKAQIFFKATIRPHTVPARADTAEEALYISLNTKLKIDLRYMSALTGKEPAELLEELGDKVFLNPQKYYGNILEGWETADEYLSGHVKDKLLYARGKAEEYPELFSRNVSALEGAQPAPLMPADINAAIGAPWIPIEYYRQFMYELLDTPNYYRSDGEANERSCITLDYMEYTTVWRVGNKSLDNASVKVTQTYGTKRRNAYEIYEDCLNLQSTTIKDKETYTDYNGEQKERYIVNPAETRIARSKQAQVKEAFAAWLWKDAERKETLLNIYNDRFNTVIPREYDGSHLVFPGMSEEMQLRPHQLNFAARVIYSGTGLAAHEVGAGKTAALIAAGMFLKNLGAIQKPVYVVPNPLVGQWATEFYRFFPNARLLVSTAEDFSAKNRNRYISRIAMGDYDAVILAHSQFERIPISAARQEEQLNGQINQIAYAISRVKEEKGDNWTVKQMMSFQKNLEVRLEKLSALEKKDDLLTFEQLGVDFMFVDEAHMFKNCFVYTKLSRVAGVNTSSSQRAFDMLNKCQYLQEVNNGRGVVFATGTPVSNSMSELFVMMRYLEPRELERQGVSDFDSWAATYGEIISSLEITPEGGGYRMRQRFARFHNLPELMRTFHLVADIQTAEMLKLPRPGIIGGKAEVVSTAATEYQQTLMKEFVARAEAIRKKEVSPHMDNMLKLTGEARLMAIDPRLIRANAPNEPESKLNLCIGRIHSIWQDTAEKHLTQLVFCDCGTPKPGQFNVYDEMKRVLLEKGVPESEVVFIHDAKTEAQRQAIFEKTRSGEIRVLIGSTGKLGTGVNVQDRVIGLHHLDVPWKPSDITQRNGRGLRQGNLNDELGIIHYITEGTFDAYLWQIQEQKLRYITQVMTSKSITRSCEDIDETVLTAAQFKAIATDNPKLLVKMELENRVSELKLLQRNYQSEQAELDRNIHRAYPAEIAQHEKAIEEISADIETLKETEGRDFSVTLDGKVYDERVKAGEMLLLYSRMLKDSGEDEKTVGEYRGFTLKIQKGFWDSQSVVLTGSHRYSAEMGTTEIGVVTRIENMAVRIPQMLDPEKRKLSEVQNQLEEAKKQYGQPFACEAELLQKSAELSEVNTELELGKAEDEEVIIDENEQPEAAQSGDCRQDRADEGIYPCDGAEV